MATEATARVVLLMEKWVWGFSRRPCWFLGHGCQRPPVVGPRGCGRVLSSWACSCVSPTATFAEEACALLTSSKFEACHHVVSPLPYLRNCRYDVCSCSDGQDCLCSAVASYAAACARRGVHVGWREPSFCGGCSLQATHPNATDALAVEEKEGVSVHVSFVRHFLCIISFGHQPRAF